LIGLGVNRAGGSALAAAKFQMLPGYPSASRPASPASGISKNGTTTPYWLPWTWLTTSANFS
jgi:hypothetical protein